MRYSAYGSFDEKPLLDGDEGFIGLNTRLDPTQLSEGVLSESKNIRLDKGTARSRKGCTLYLGASTNNVETPMDAVPYDSGSTQDNVLVFSTNGNAKYAHIYNGPTLVSQVTFPALPYNYTLTNAFLLNTKVNTLLFQGKGPTLPFTEGDSLGHDVLRLAKGDTEFKHFKQVNFSGHVRNAGGTNVHTITCTETPSLNVGEKFRVVGLIGSGGPTDNIWKVLSITDKVIKFTSSTTQHPALNSTGGIQGILYSVDNECPPADFATWAGNRLIVPFGDNELAISSSLSTHNFPITNRLVIDSGESGSITALEPLADDSLLVFKNHSIHAVQGVYEMKGSVEGGRLAITRITDQLGCIARKTIQVIGSEVLFLSPQGIYGLSLNSQSGGGVGLPVQAVRVADVALSRDIDNLIDSIDQANASACFFRGRYYLCDGDEIYVYSTILQAFESVDSVPNGVIKLFSIFSSSSQLIALHSSSKILNLETSESNVDTYYGGTENFESKVTTRAYRFKTFEQKHFRRAMVSWQGQDSNNSFRVDIESENPDGIDTIVNQSNIGSGTFNTRTSLRGRGESIKATISNNFAGRFSAKRIAFEAMPGSRQTTEFN
jgi:hypothetical protein